MAEAMQAQFQVLEHQAAQLMRVHGEAMRCCDVEDFMQVVRLIYRTSMQMIAERQQQAAAKYRPYTITEAREWETQFHAMLRAIETINPLIDHFQQQGFSLAGLTEFREAEHDLRGMLSISVDQIPQAKEDLRAGRSRPLSEVRGELQRHLRANG
jgi:hypothetical protein